jgi:hypothetical protein
VSFLEEIHATQNPLQMASGYKVNRVVDGLEHLNKSGVESLIFFLYKSQILPTPTCLRQKAMLLLLYTKVRYYFKDS